MPASEQIKALVAQMPDPDERGMYCHVVVGRDDQGKVKSEPIDKGKIDRAIAEIRKAGRDGVVGVIDLLVEPLQTGDPMPVKAHYALHVLALEACKQGGDARRAFADAVASQVGGDRPRPVQAYLIQELQTAGEKEVAPVLAKALADEELCEPAARALMAIGGAAGPLRAALPAARGQCRLTILQDLGVVGDAASAPAFQAALGDADPDVRLAGAWGLANLGAAAAADALLKAADAREAWERVQLTKACLVLAEKCAAAGDKATAARIYKHLKDTRTDHSEAYVAEAAAKALEAVQ